ncbi:MAG: hypothetical protein WCV56_03455 [Candidatus Omnitrophota bacterium]
MFRVEIMSSERTLYEGEAWSVFFPGASGEFEVMDLHKPIVSLLAAGDIVIDQKRRIPIKRGVMRMQKEVLISLVDER